MVEVPEWTKLVDVAHKYGGPFLTVITWLVSAEHLNSDRCRGCKRSSRYRVVGGAKRRAATVLAFVPLLGVTAAAWLNKFDDDALPVWAGWLIFGILIGNWVYWLRVARHQRNALKCILCGEAQSIPSGAQRRPVERSRRKKR